MARWTAVAGPLTIENPAAKVPQRCLSDISIQPPVAGQDPKAVATVVHVSSHNVSMRVHLGVAAGAGDLGHAGGDAATGLRVSEFRSSANADYQVSKYCLKLTRIIIFLSDITGDNPVRS